MQRRARESAGPAVTSATGGTEHVRRRHAKIDCHTRQNPAYRSARYLEFPTALHTAGRFCIAGRYLLYLRRGGSQDKRLQILTVLVCELPAGVPYSARYVVCTRYSAVNTRFAGNTESTGSQPARYTVYTTCLPRRRASAGNRDPQTSFATVLEARALHVLYKELKTRKTFGGVLSCRGHSAESSAAVRRPGHGHASSLKMTGRSPSLQLQMATPGFLIQSP